MKFSRIFDAQVVLIPFVQMLSLTAQGIPSNGASSSPRAIFSSTSLASATALSRVIVRYAPILSSTSSTRANTSAVNSVAEIFFAANKPCNSCAVLLYKLKSIASLALAVLFSYADVFPQVGLEVQPVDGTAHVAVFHDALGTEFVSLEKYAKDYTKEFWVEAPNMSLTHPMDIVNSKRPVADRIANYILVQTDYKQFV